MEAMMDSMMTGLANNQLFAPVLEYDVCLEGTIFSHIHKVGQFADLVNHAVFIFGLAQFTGARAICQRSSLATHKKPSEIIRAVYALTLV
jgi:hypothetical protein